MIYVPRGSYRHADALVGKLGFNLVNKTANLGDKPFGPLGKIRFQFFLGALTCLLASIITFFYVQDRVADTFILRSQYMLIWIFFGCFLGYFLLKSLLYAVVNWAFFDKKSNRTWQKTLLFMVCVEGVAIFPLVLLQTYFNMIIFFLYNGAFLQNILYFCALEIVPLFSLGGLLVTIVDFLKINF